VYNASVNTLEQAILERSFFCEIDGKFEEPLICNSEGFKTPELQDFQGRVVEYVSKRATRTGLREVVNAYSGPKRAVYQRAYEGLAVDKLNRAKDRRLSVFAKFEKLSVAKAARVINPPSARYGLVLGKYLKLNEEVYFKAINHAWGARTSRTVIKGVDVFDAAEVLRAKWDEFEDPVAIGLDARKFDAHVSKRALRYEHKFYNRVFKAEELREVLEWQLDSESIGYCYDGRIQASFPGTRCSGDLNTSLGNCLLMCSMIWAYARERGLKCELANNGDDCVVIMNRADVARFMADVDKWFAIRGFRMTVEKPVDEFEKVEFCQSRPVFDGTRWRMVRNPFTCLIKDPMCLRPLTTVKGLRKWRGAVGRGGLSLVSGIPVMQAFYGSMLRGTQACSDRYFTNVVCKGNSLLERGAHLKSVVSEVSADARSSFAVAFGINPAEQVAMESYYNDLTLVDTLSVVGGCSIPLIDLAPLVF